MVLVGVAVPIAPRIEFLVLVEMEATVAAEEGAVVAAAAIWAARVETVVLTVVAVAVAEASMRMTDIAVVVLEVLVGHMVVAVAMAELERNPE